MNQKNQTQNNTLSSIVASTANFVSNDIQETIKE